VFVYRLKKGVAVFRSGHMRMMAIGVSLLTTYGLTRLDYVNEPVVVSELIEEHCYEIIHYN